MLPVGRIGKRWCCKIDCQIRLLWPRAAEPKTLCVYDSGHKKVTNDAYRARFSRHILPLVAVCVGDLNTFDKNRLCSLAGLRLDPVTVAQTLFTCQSSPYSGLTQEMVGETSSC